MIPTRLRRDMRATLYSAAEEGLLVKRLPEEMIDELRGQREILTAQAVVRADALAVRRLDVDDDQDATSDVPALPMPAAARDAARRR